MSTCTETPATIHAFWFGPHVAELDDAAIAHRQTALWWRKNPAVDAAMRTRFAGCIEQAAAGALDGWTATPQGCLALVLLMDQFTRNVHRDTPAAFACDAQARAWVRAALDAREDTLLRPIERVFLYLPFEHAEDMADQGRAVALFTALHDGVPPAQREPFKGFLDYALKHRTVIARFGRFPHRNAILGRTSTEEEIAFLAQPGSRF
ncbi:DUF924 domain-containing protein [Oxalobacteraceae bacterium OM1]|nr:DUF924 domain-containing protein [Oxalobacteraceae bacterium OM1]